uniref:Uncharacterized protein n=1 Tax=Oryza meridionalis TaxID=40149 RepID=A0A0E0EQJ1_9ORYZ
MATAVACEGVQSPTLRPGESSVLPPPALDLAGTVSLVLPPCLSAALGAGSGGPELKGAGSGRPELNGTGSGCLELAPNKSRDEGKRLIGWRQRQ